MGKKYVILIGAFILVPCLSGGEKVASMLLIGQEISNDPHANIAALSRKIRLDIQKEEQFIKSVFTAMIVAQEIIESKPPEATISFTLVHCYWRNRIEYSRRCHCLSELRKLMRYLHV